MEIWSKLTTYASCWAHVQLIICTQFQWAEGFARIVPGSICGRGTEYPDLFFHLLFPLNPAFSSAYFI